MFASAMQPRPDWLVMVLVTIDVWTMYKFTYENEPVVCTLLYLYVGIMDVYFEDHT